ncbi:MAG: 50S ribosomal protein L7/L12 [Candidatus Margulisiibacteriota bacterium]
MAELTKDAEKVIETIEKMTVLDLSHLVKALEEKFGVTAAAPVAMMAASSGGSAPAVAEEVSDEVTVILSSAGDKKIQVLKVIREITGLGLKEAKDLVDSAPKAVKENIKKDEASEIKKKLEAEGATVEIK